MDSDVSINPWTVSTFKEFLYYCCPECDIKTKEEALFFQHALEKHRQAQVALAVKVELQPLSTDQIIKSEVFYSNNVLEEKVELDPLSIDQINDCKVSDSNCGTKRKIDFE